MEWLKKLLGIEKQEAAPMDVVTVKREAPDLYVFRISGVLSKTAVDKMQALARREIDRGTKDLKTLIILAGFKGFQKGGAWGDLDFFMEYGDAIAKIAVVGEARWQEHIMVFLLADRRRGEVRYFAPEQEAQARAWLK